MDPQSGTAGEGAAASARTSRQAAATLGSARAGIWLELLGLCWRSYRRGSLPIAALVTDAEGRVLARGRNRLAERPPAPPADPEAPPPLEGTQLAHAEVEAILRLGRDRPRPRPILWSTLEPCPLCMGAARMGGIGHVVYAARDPWAGCAAMTESVPYLVRLGPTAEGPSDAVLERRIVAWNVAAHARRVAADAAFMRDWRAAAPEAVAAGFDLHARGELRAWADAGGDVAGALERIDAALAAQGA